MTAKSAAGAERIDLLITPEVMYPMDGTRDAILNAEIAIREGRIVYAGPAFPAGHWSAREQIDGRGKAALPGFVNAHCHTGSTVFRAQTDDGAGGRALYSVAFRGEGIVADEDWARLARLGIAEMIRAGYTTLNDFWYAPDATAEVAQAIGLRLQIACEIVDVDKARLADGDWTRHPAIGERSFAQGVAVARHWHQAADGLITARLGPHAVDTVSGGLFREVTQEARAMGVGLHCHAAQSRIEADRIRQWHGCGPAAWLAELGVLGPDWVLAHLSFAQEDDIRAVAESGAANAHAACIYPRRGVRAPVSALRAAGIRVGLASDWMLNDPWEGMRMVQSMMRTEKGDHQALSSLQALEMATRDAARALGLGAQIGTLAPGFEADLILVDLDRPHLQPFYAEPASLVWYARADDVVTSIVRGRVLMQNRQIVGFDLDEALADVRQRTPYLAGQMRSVGGTARIGLCPCGPHRSASQ